MAESVGETNQLLGDSQTEEGALLLMQVTEESGEAWGADVFKKEWVASLLEGLIGTIMREVELVSKKDILVELVPEAEVEQVVRLVHGVHVHEGVPVRIACAVAGKGETFEWEREKGQMQRDVAELCSQRETIEKEVERSRQLLAKKSSVMLQEYEGCKVHVTGLLQNIKEQMGLLEQVKSETEERRREGFYGGNGGETRINKLPKFPLFSGEEPIPRDECNIETFLFQVKGARKDVTDRAVRTALIRSLRRGASDFVEYIGLDTPLNTIIESLTDRYSSQDPEDTLICQFHQMAQEKSETIREFAGRIEKVFRRLQIQVPERYPDELLLKDRLFYGMNPQLKNSLRFLHSKDNVAYSDLLRAAHAAEVESNRGKALRAKTMAVKTEDPQDPQNQCLREVSQKMGELAAIMKATQLGEPKSHDKPRTKGTHQPKSTKPDPLEEAMAAGQKALQCWRCGGWGHVSRKCSTPNRINWKELQKQAVIPSLLKEGK